MGQIQDLKQKSAQVGTMTPAQLALQRLLGLGVCELSAKINEEIQNNPAFDDEVVTGGMGEEKDASSEDFDVDDPLSVNGDDGMAEDGDDGVRDDKDDLDSYMPDDYEDESRGGRVSGGEDRDPIGYQTASSVSAIEELEDQLSMISLSEKERKICSLLVKNLDEGLFLVEDDYKLADCYAQEYGELIEIEDVEAGKKILRQLEPAGIGAADMRERFMMQIEAMEESGDSKLLKKIISEHYELFTKQSFGALAELLDVEDERIRDVFEFAAKHLNPTLEIGSSGASSGEVIPDFVIVELDRGGLGVELNDGNMPVMKISESFRQFAGKDKASIDFVNGNILKAEQFMESVAQWKKTMIQVMQAIMSFQVLYFESGDIKYLKPMVLADIARKTGLDESTISRVTTSKYIEHEGRVFPMKSLFSASVGGEKGEGVSTVVVKNELKEIVDGEDKKNPFSDSQLVEKLKEKGYTIARRTVVKYRTELGIPSSVDRKG